MTILEAAQRSHEGYEVVSCAGNIYRPCDLQVKWVGAHYASLNNDDMTEDERKGEWSLGCKE